jgi:hypothetical protein
MLIDYLGDHVGNGKKEVVLETERRNVSGVGHKLRTSKQELHKKRKYLEKEIRDRRFKEIFLLNGMLPRRNVVMTFPFSIEAHAAVKMRKSELYIVHVIIIEILYFRRFVPHWYWRSS